MKLPLKVAIIPEPGNMGEDLNWVGYLVVGHMDGAALSKEVLNELFKEFFAMPINDEDNDNWEDLSSNERHELLASFLDAREYVVFPITYGIRWCVP